MPKYNIYTKIESNVSAVDLFYDLNVYRTDASNKKHILLSVAQQPVTSNYQTQSHETNDTEDGLSVIYIMEMNLYRKHGGKLFSVLSSPAKKMYTLGEMASGQAYSKNKRENVCYFETKTQTKPVNDKGEDNIHTVQITCQKRAFIAKEYPVGSPDDPFDRSKFEDQVSSRINYSSFPDQGRTSLCGPASFFYCLQMDRPDVYKQAAIDLWMQGKTKIGTLDITPGDGCKHPKGSFYFSGSERISGLDWITLASLRDSENSIMSYDDIDDEVAGITMWGKITEWFEKSGYVKIYTNVGLGRCSIEDVVRLSEYADNGFKVVCLISAGMLFDFGSDDTSYKNHWVVWAGALKKANGKAITKNSPPDEIVNLKLFSWGAVKNQIKLNKDLEYVRKHIFGGVVFKPLN
ncbi:hypothetical protein CWM58_01640 [Klebsiella sp. H-Nf2]|uniref:hypothetical protein n=1 Tax=Klebsiella sp. H-Nf2 TaxID=2054599 RepID=UPI000C292629|nr:hypothetical protein [Klebsiella sp. H-Nf2]PJR51870.1 hypothetical protein CWM58_01640 [Klebsiella sp. H-Nf2]